MVPSKVKRLNVGWRLSGVFRFTPEELATMKRRMQMTLRAVSCDEMNADDEFTVFNRRMIHRALKCIADGRQNRFLPTKHMFEVYRAAWSAYRAALALGRSETEARQSATMHAQTPLEKWMEILPRWRYGPKSNS